MIKFTLQRLPSKEQLAVFGLTYDNVAECLPTGFTLTAGVDCHIETHIKGSIMYQIGRRDTDTLCVGLPFGGALPMEWFTIKCPDISPEDAAIWLAYDEVADLPTWGDIIEQYCSNTGYDGTQEDFTCEIGHRTWIGVKQVLSDASINPTEYKGFLTQLMGQDDF